MTNQLIKAIKSGMYTSSTKQALKKKMSNSQSYICNLTKAMCACNIFMKTLLPVRSSAHYT